MLNTETRISYDKNGYSKKEVWTKTFNKLDLEAVLYHCKNDLSKESEKGKNGAIYPVYDLIEETSYGVIFCDLDYITKETAERIFNSFEEICKVFPSVLAVQYSSSYYISTSKAGLHIYIKSPSLYKDEYTKYAEISLAFLAKSIYKVLGIDLRISQIDNQKIIDTHNTHIYQRFFLFYSDYKINNNAYSLFDELEVSKEQISKAKEEYPEIIREHNTVNVTDVKLDNIEFTNVTKERLCIDRNFKIGELSGNDIRWRISRIAQSLFGKDAKSWCDRYFYYEKNKSIYTHQNSIEGISIVIKNWLIKEGYLKEVSENIIRRGEWINKYSDDIIEFINNNRKVEIVAPTGVGKTSLINGYRNPDELFANEFSLAKELNAIVVVPFNVTNKLYNNLTEVSSEKRVAGQLKTDESYVMIWDQALIHWEDIKNRTLIIDEAHCLFLDRTYRNTAVKLMNKIKEDDCKIVLFTATPSGESEELGCKILKFKNERDIVEVGFNKVNSVDLAELGVIKYCLDNNYYDKIVLFDDMNAKKIWERLIVEGNYINDIAYIRADTKNSEDFISLRENEVLNKKLTICTCVAFNGLNFKNENENILVITSLVNNKTTAAEIIQEAGRIRKSKVSVVIYYDDIYNENTLERRIEKTNELRKAELEYDIPDAVLSYDRNLLDINIVDALRKISSHLDIESNIDKIIERMNDCGYFNIKMKDNQNDEFNKGNKLRLALKAKESKEFIEDLLNDDIKEYTENTYKYNWNKRIEHIINNENYSGIDIDTFKTFIEKKKNKKTLIETIISNIEKIIRISLINEIEWKKYIINKDNIKNCLSNELDRRDFENNYKNNVKIREQYSGKIKVVNNDSNSVLYFGDLFEDMFKELEMESNMIIEKRSEGGKKSKRAGKPVVINGIEYDSPKIAAEKLNVSLSWITRHRD